MATGGGSRTPIRRRVADALAPGFASTWVASGITAAAFLVLDGFGLLGNLPLELLLGVLAAAAVLAEASRRLVGPNPTGPALWLGIGVQVVATSVVIYAIGWGGALGIGYVFVIARQIEDYGPQVWRPAIVWTAAAMTAGELAIAAGLIGTYIGQPEVHALSALMVIGVAFIAQMLAGKVAEQRRSAAELQASEADFRQLFAANPQPMWVFDAETLAFLEVNEAAIRHYGYSRQEFLARRVVDIRPTSDVRASRSHLEGHDRDPVQGEWRHVLKDGRIIDVEVRSHRFAFESRPAILAAVQDVTERNSLQAALQHQAFHDSLTNLANRALFSDRVEHAIERGARDSTTVGVLLLDLDGFKTVNDSLGHTAGDELLVAVAQRLRTVLRPSDTAARLGGDEFAVLLEDLVGADEAREVAERVIDALGHPFALAGTEVVVQASIGITVAGHVGADPEALLRNADAAMYSAKNQGKGCYRLFEPAMHSAAVARLQLEGDLRQAVEAGEFVLHYQPVVSLDAGRVVALEALVRWQHPTRGLLPPADFIPIAEDNGLIVQIGRWVLDTACRQARAWQEAHPELCLTVAVNVSPRQLADPALVDDVRRALANSGLAPETLTLEITERVLIDDTGGATARLGELKDTGVRLAIDDFGIGYSSLSALQRLPVDTLKIDKAFIDDVTTGVEADALVQAILRLARTFHLVTIAEGVERTDQVRRLEELGCDQIQGFCFSRPVPGDRVEALLRDVPAAASEPVPLSSALSDR
jgi:diguanylate cyclase (GGDEF)-like protein/PAS domain S-box-containing protein